MRRLGLSLCRATTRDSTPRRWLSRAATKAKAPAAADSSSSVDAALYRQLSAVEHVLLRPGMYIGPVERQTEPAWVFEGGRMVWREVSCVPALLKLFDEVLVNAMDNVQRKSGTRSIEVRIGAAGAAEPELPAGALSIYNDGLGIPVSQATAKSHGASAAGVWLPQLVLGELYTGSNFDDGAGRTVGGRHGFGAKLANIFSHSFTVETADTRAGLFYSQTWTRNMSEVGTPVVMALGGEAKDFTRVTMRPDYSRLLGLAPGAPPLDADTLSLLVRRVHEAAACVWPDATVSLNGAPVAVEGLEGLMRLYPRSEATAVVRQLGPRWRVGVTAPPDGSFAHVSFVNGVATSRGGTHVEAVERQLLRALAPKLARALGVRAGEEPLPASALRPHLMLFVDAKVEDPDFDSQAKERLTTPIDKLGSKVELPSSFVAEVAALPWLREAVAAERRMRDARSLARAVGRAKVRRGSNLEIEKLDDAEWAGMAGKAEQCTLIVTEGDSAKALAVAGLEVVGRERWGVFPLRGKLLNVRGAVQSRVGKNEELVALMRALGVEPGAKVSLDPETGAAVGLRYGRLMLMTDQDEDGAHIKGLVISMLHHFWPALTRGSFVQEFVTPLLKAHRRKQGGSVEFYSLAAYDRWRAALPASEAAAWRTKYYKGLGTSTAAEAREYFRAMHRHRVQLTTSDESRADDLIDMAFSPARAADRKEWMNKAIAEEEAGGGQGVRGQPEAGEGLTEAGEEAAAGEVAVREAEAGGEVAAREVAAAAGAITPMGPDGDASASATVCLELLQLGVKELKQEARRLGVSPIPKSKDDLLRAVEQASAAETRDAALSAAAALATPASRSLESFVQGDLVHFSLSALRRSLPSVVDGLKPSQRKVLHACFKKRLLPPTEMKVAQLASYVADVTQYHHGEASLVQTIVKMAQDFVGASNVPLLEPLGQFGTRALGGNDAASARYIFTRLSPITPLLFPQADAPILQYQVEDGSAVEPIRFVPLLPLILLNGAAGIGTGWSTNVWSYHPLHVLDAATAVLRGDPLPVLHPWVRGFTGSFEATDESGFESVGRARLTTEGVEVTELPLGTWTQDYKAWLMQQQKLDDPPWRSFSERHTERHVHFFIHASAAQLKALRGKADLTRALQLRKRHMLTNMHAFDHQGRLLRLASASEAVARFVPVRLAAYEARKAYQLSVLRRQHARMAAQARFIAMVSSGEVLLTRVPRADIETRLGALSFSREDPGASAKATADSESGLTVDVPVATASSGAEESSASTRPKAAPFDYLLRLSLADLTAERVLVLQAKCEAAAEEMRLLAPKTAAQMYEEELAELRPRLEALLDKEG